VHGALCGTTLGASRCEKRGYDGTALCATQDGVGADNPTHPSVLSEMERDRIVLRLAQFLLHSPLVPCTLLTVAYASVCTDLCVVQVPSCTRSRTSTTST
jgi:hypothetical protein